MKGLLSDEIIAKQFFAISFPTDWEWFESFQIVTTIWYLRGMEQKEDLKFFKKWKFHWLDRSEHCPANAESIWTWEPFKTHSPHNCSAILWREFFVMASRKTETRIQLCFVYVGYCRDVKIRIENASIVVSAKRRSQGNSKVLIVTVLAISWIRRA